MLNFLQLPSLAFFYICPPGYLTHTQILYDGIEADDSQRRISQP